jgi:hypothetical protein
MSVLLTSTLTVATVIASIVEVNALHPVVACLGVLTAASIVTFFAAEFTVKGLEDTEEALGDLAAPGAVPSYLLAGQPPAEASAQQAPAGHAQSANAVEPPAFRQRRGLLRDRRRLRGRVRAQATLRTLFTIAILGDAAAGTVYAIHVGLVLPGIGGAMLVLLLGLQITRDRARVLEAEVRQLDYETAIVDAEAGHKAETFFLKHQFELRRYYDQTLRQGASVFALGVLLLGLGAGVAVTGMVLIASGSGSTARDLSLGGLAAVSSILTGFVARTYFRMHKAATDAVASFHDRLVSDHNLHFANLLIEQLDHPEAVRETIALMIVRESLGGSQT